MASVAPDENRAQREASHPSDTTPAWLGVKHLKARMALGVNKTSTSCGEVKAKRTLKLIAGKFSETAVSCTTPFRNPTSR
jgi:hypothetical protein